MSLHDVPVVIEVIIAVESDSSEEAREQVESMTDDELITMISTQADYINSYNNIDNKLH